jgi:hypothetical protein
LNVGVVLKFSRKRIESRFIVQRDTSCANVQRRGLGCEL